MIRLRLVADGPDHAPCGTLVVGLYQGERGPKGEAGWVDWRLGGALSRAILAGRVDGTAGMTVLMPAKKLPCKRVLVVGMGPQAEFKGKNLAIILDGVLEKVEGFQDMDLAIALPCVLILLVGRPVVVGGWGIGVKVVASWLTAVAILATMVSLTPTPGYVQDHME